MRELDHQPPNYSPSFPECGTFRSRDHAEVLGLKINMNCSALPLRQRWRLK